VMHTTWCCKRVELHYRRVDVRLTASEFVHKCLYRFRMGFRERNYETEPRATKHFVSYFVLYKVRNHFVPARALHQCGSQQCGRLADRAESVQRPVACTPRGTGDRGIHVPSKSSPTLPIARSQAPLLRNSLLCLLY
jgi:hypothetical protein